MVIIVMKLRTPFQCVKEKSKHLLIEISRFNKELLGIWQKNAAHMRGPRAKTTDSEKVKNRIWRDTSYDFDD